ncbi:MAG: class I SAM-dependent methyltransferase [Anaerolineales bacterium]
MSQLGDFKREISEAAETSRNTFFTWFNAAANADASFVSGMWDFGVHIAYPMAKYLKVPDRLVCLEIGHGGGRLLAAAAQSFGKAIGIDIHENNELVKKELAARGVKNVELFSSDGMTFPLPDSSIDFVYSFIVLQHVGKIEVFRSYLADSLRLLKPGGVGILYFGRKVKYSANKKSPLLFKLDSILEGIWLPEGYLEFSAEVNHTNLIVTRAYAKRLAQSIGYKVLGFTVSYKKVPDGFGSFGGQHGIMLRKPL